MCVRILYKHSQVDQECRVFNNLSTLRQQVHSKRRTLGSYVYSATMYLEKVVPKMCSLDPKGSATSSQGIRGYTSVMATLKFTYVSWMSLAFLFHHVMLNMFRMLIHPSSGVCDLFVELFHGLYCSGTMRVGVTVWFGWGGVVSGRRLQPAYGYHTTTTQHQHTSYQSSTTHEITQQISRKLLRTDVLTFEIC